MSLISRQIRLKGATWKEIEVRGSSLRPPVKRGAMARHYVETGLAAALRPISEWEQEKHGSFVVLYEVRMAGIVDAFIGEPTRPAGATHWHPLPVPR